MSRSTPLAMVALASMLAVFPVLILRAEEPDEGATKVTIRSSETKEPIADARIWTYVWEDTWVPPGWRWAGQGAVQITGQDGSAEVLLGQSRVGRGRTAIVVAGHRGVATYIRPGEDLVMLPPADPVMGVVIHERTLQPVPNATVKSYVVLDGMCDICGHNHVTGLGPSRGAAETDATGRFRLGDGGRFGLLSIECAGFATLWMGVSLDEDVTAVKVLLPKASGVTGVVRDASGRPVAGAGVVAHPAYAECLLDTSRVWIEGSTPHMWKDSPLWKAAHPSTATTDESGRFLFDALVPGTAYWVWSKHGDSFGMIEASTETWNPKRETVDLVLAPLSSVKVMVETASGEPAGDVPLVIYRRQRVPPYSRRGSTDIDGEITFRSMPPGRYVMRVEDQRPAVEEVIDLPGENERIVLRLR